MWFRRKPPLPGAAPAASRAASLSMRPVRNREVSEEPLDAGLVRLAYPARVRPWFAGAAQRLGLWDGKPLTRKLELDELGSFCWGLVDGRRTVRDIAVELAAAYLLPEREAQLAVAAFLRELGRRGVIGVTDEESHCNAPDAFSRG